MSHNHTIRHYREDEKRWHCGVKNCLNKATHVCSYDYTNSYGTALTLKTDRCRKHAQGFQQRHTAKYVSNQDNRAEQ